MDDDEHERMEYINEAERMERLNQTQDTKWLELQAENNKLRKIIKKVEIELENAEDPDVITYLLDMLKGLNI